MNGEQELTSKQNQLIEIYKIHVELTNNVSNRRTTTNRFYQVFLSGLIVIFSTFLQSKDGVPVKLLEDVSIDWVMTVLGGLGMWLSFTWFISVDSYLQLNSRKYEVLKELEEKLEYRFFKKEWKYLGGNKKDTYRYLSFPELLAPIAFFIFFTVLFSIGIYKLQNGNSHHRLLVIIAVLYPLMLIFSLWLFRILRRHRSFDE